MSLGENDDTDNLGNPFIVENNGNIVANVTRISANASLFNTQALDTIYMRFKIDAPAERS